jgi:hypothetical protein
MKFTEYLIHISSSNFPSLSEAVFSPNTTQQWPLLWGFFVMDFSHNHQEEIYDKLYGNCGP